MKKENINFLFHGRLTQRSGTKLTAANWREIGMKRMEDIPWDRAVKDVSPFLERSQDMSLLTLENVRNLLLNPNPYSEGDVLSWVSLAPLSQSPFVF
jgi:hypothetical protein